MTDPVKRSDELDAKLGVFPVDRVFTKRAVVILFVTLIFFIVVSGVVVLKLAQAGLQNELDDRDRQITVLEAANKRQSDTITALEDQIREMGGTPESSVVIPQSWTT